MKRAGYNAVMVLKKYLSCVLFVSIPSITVAQRNISINMAPIDGVAITPDNIFNYQVQSSGPGIVEIRGTIRYRNSNLSLSYTSHYNISQGVAMLDANALHPQWQFSSPALQELFFMYKVLPSGTFEYCVTITPINAAQENNGGVFDECLYHRSDDFFLINLIDPANKAKIQEYNPMLAWVANYSFSNELTYRLRIAEIKQGQNPVNAIMRNQPMYDEKNLMLNSLVYPVYAKPLVANQPYAWTVDAYYKGILLGGAETWQFIILDSTPVPVKASRSHIDIKREDGSNKLYVVGELKLKYVLDETQKDSLYLEIFDEKQKKHSTNPDKLIAVYGDNRYELNLAESSNLKHKSTYILKIHTKTKHEYKLVFQYLNPEYLH